MVDLRTYKATGKVLTATLRLFGVDVRITGLDELPERPILFLVNHFTRFETFLVPYVIFHRYGRPVHSLAAAMFFGGRLGRYLTRLGSVSVRDPRRNRLIVGELMTGTSDWVIYPEGQMVKDRCARPARTGAAVMALQAELRKRRYRRACAEGDADGRAFYEREYGLTGPEDLAEGGTVVVPVTITYPNLRPRRNFAHRVAGLLRATLNPILDEELQVEGSILFGGQGISLHFGEPIEVSAYVNSSTRKFARRIAGWFDESKPSEILLRRPAARLTTDTMQSVYGKTEINLDHLFCYGLRAVRETEVAVRRFRDAMYLAAMRLRKEPDVRLHPALRNGVIKLATTEPFAAFDHAEALAVREGVLERRADMYVIHREMLDAVCDPHSVRLERLVQVIANELEPIRAAARVVREVVNLDEPRLQRHVAAVLRERDRVLFRDEYARFHDPAVSKPAGYGEPFFLDARRPRSGVVLVHGYLACPEQMRPLATALHAAGHVVYCIRLDGHGTAPVQLRDVHLPAWLDTIAQAHAIVRRHAPRVIVGGFSLGGVLSALHAARRGDDIAGLFTINAPMVLRNRWAPLVPTVLRISRMASRLGAERDLAELNNASETPDLNYETDYLHGIQELRTAMRDCRRTLHRVTARSLIIQTEDDPVVHPRSAELLAEGMTHVGGPTPLIARLPGRRHVVIVDEDREPYIARVARFLELFD